MSPVRKSTGKLKGLLGVDVEGDFDPKYEVSTDKKAVVKKLKVRELKIRKRRLKEILLIK